MKVIIIRTNDSDDYLKTLQSAKGFFKEEDIHIQENFEGIIDKGIMFAVPFLCNYKGFAIGITDHLIFSKRTISMLFDLPPLDPYTHSMDGNIVIWNCEHETSMSSFSHRNLEDVKKNTGSYLNKISHKETEQYSDLRLGVSSND